ncbi:MAG TPA: lipid A biosynthesis acyltransferase [Spirochaetota bacterium]
MTQWKGKTRGGVLGYKFFVFFITRFDLSVAYFFLRFVAFYFLFFAPRAFRAIYLYFRFRRKMGVLKAVLAVYGNFYALGQALVDKIAALSSAKAVFTFDYDGEHYLNEMAAAGKGGFLVSAHVGNWDIAGNLLKRIDSRVHIVMRDAEHLRIKQYLGNVMTENRLNIIPIKDDLSHIVQIRDALAHNDLVCIHGDRFMEGAKTITVPFLGKDARFPQGPFLLPATFGVPVTFVFAMKESSRHYHFYATEPITPQVPRNRKEREMIVENLVKKYTDNLEVMLNRYPLQWFNYYDFWK